MSGECVRLWYRPSVTRLTHVRRRNSPKDAGFFDGVLPEEITRTQAGGSGQMSLITSSYGDFEFRGAVVLSDEHSGVRGPNTKQPNPEEIAWVNYSSAAINLPPCESYAVPRQYHGTNHPEYTITNIYFRFGPEGSGAVLRRPARVESIREATLHGGRPSDRRAWVSPEFPLEFVDEAKGNSRVNQ